MVRGRSAVEYGMELIEEDLDRISDELEMAFKRYPVLQEAGIKSWATARSPFRPTAIRLSVQSAGCATTGLLAE